MEEENILKKVFKCEGEVISFNPAKKTKEGNYRTSFLVKAKLLNKTEWLTCQLFHPEKEFALELSKPYLIIIEPKGIRVKDIITGNYRYMNVWNVTDYYKL